MITVQQVEEKLFDWAPRQMAESWDNVGQLVGDPGREVRRVLVSLDITEPVVQEAVEGGFDLIVSHHPVMNCTWHPVQTLRTDDRQGRILTKMAENRISAICMHTNLDAADGRKNRADRHVKMRNTPCGVHPFCDRIFRMQWSSVYGLRQARSPRGGGRRRLRRLYPPGHRRRLRHLCNLRPAVS